MQDSGQTSGPPHAHPAGGPEHGREAVGVDFADVNVSIGGAYILQHVTLSLGGSNPVVLIGPNGAGKTTLIRLAMGLLAPTSGTLSYRGGAGDPGNRAIVFQKPVMLRRTTAANVAFALKAAGKPAGTKDVQRLLEMCKIGDLERRSARSLSGGEQQRLALARALAREPKILFLDEPTASLDPAATRLVEDIILATAASGVSVVLSTHDLGQARRIASEIVFVAGGRMVEQAPAGPFFAGPQSAKARRFIAGDLIV